MKLSDGFAEPILWGAKQGYAIAEIAAGLAISEALVRRVIEERSGVRFPRPAPVDPTRTEPDYRAWARARTGATATLAGPPP